MDALRTARKAQGLSLRKLGELSGVDWRRIGDWELGLRRPDADQRLKLLSTLGLRDDDIPSPYQVFRLADYERYLGGRLLLAAQETG